MNLANEIQIQNEVRDPLIVDREALVILDGMHRYNALKRISCRLAPTCLVDYDDERIKVGAWYRVLKVDRSDSVATEALEAQHLNYNKRELIKFNRIDLANAAIITEESVFELTDYVDANSKLEWAVKLERFMARRGFSVQYAAENIISETVTSNANVIIPVPIFTKAQIRETARSARLLPHKVTRHVIPSRPLRLDVPLDLLRDHGLEEANERLNELLSTRHIDRKPPGSIVDGRRYQEELLVFES